MPQVALRRQTPGPPDKPATPAEQNLAQRIFAAVAPPAPASEKKKSADGDAGGSDAQAAADTPAVG
jgi:hypothetical protein